VRQVFALAESYPELKAAESYLSLQRNLSDIEDHIQNARRYYNAVVRDLNTKVAQFPSNLVASATGFRPQEFFGLSDPSEQATPQIDLGTNQ
jgi:LemA protein